MIFDLIKCVLYIVKENSAKNGKCLFSENDKLTKLSSLLIIEDNFVKEGRKRSHNSFFFLFNSFNIYFILIQTFSYPFHQFIYPPSPIFLFNPILSLFGTFTCTTWPEGVARAVIIK